MAKYYMSEIQKKEMRRKTWRKVLRDWQLYAMLLPALLSAILLQYLPMSGILIAFQDFSIFNGLFGSEWVGFDNIKRIFSTPMFVDSIWKTLLISLLNILISFPAPIILALLINELKDGAFKRVTQTISYLPHFLSWISVVGIIQLLFGRDGLINDFRMALGAGERISFLGEQSLFVWFVIGATLWKEVGWGTVVHLANLSSINTELYEAAEVDGAKHLQKLWYITLPHMIPTVMILLIFKMGTIFGSNFELVYGLQNPFIDFEVISTIVFKTGIQNGDYSMSTALGVTQGFVALVLVMLSNRVSKKVSGAGLI